MNWVFMRHEFVEPDDKRLKSSHCHPWYYKERQLYIANKYWATSELTSVANLHLDFGGMIRQGDPCVDIELGGGRTFSCWKHHISYAIECLERSSSFKHGRMTIHKFARWPDVICFISHADLVKILRVLKYEENLYDETAHRVEMREMLVNANVAEHGKEAESEIRKMLGAPAAHGN